MYDGVLSQGYPEKPFALASALYFVLLVVLGNCIQWYHNIEINFHIMSNDTCNMTAERAWLSVKSNPEFFFFIFKCKTKTDCVFLRFRKLVCFSTLSSGKLCVVFHCCSGCSDYYVSRHSAVKRSYTMFRWRFQSVLTILLSRPTFRDPELDWSSV